MRVLANKTNLFVLFTDTVIILYLSSISLQDFRRTALEDPPKRPRLKGGAAGGLGVKLKSLLNCDHGKNIEIRDSTQTAVINILDLLIL